MSQLTELLAKLKDILTIPPQNAEILDSNATILNTTQNYEQWANGDGQYLLPFLLTLSVAFFFLLMITHCIMWIVIESFRCIRKSLSGASDSEDSSSSSKTTAYNSSSGGKSKSMNSNPSSAKISIV